LEPDPGASTSVVYGPTVQAVPLTADLGGASQFSAGPHAGSLAAGALDTYSFGLRASEIHSTATGTAFVGVLVRASAGSPLQPARGGPPRPALPPTPGPAPLPTQTGAGFAFALFAPAQGGQGLLQFAGADGAPAGAYSLRLFVAGAANRDGNVDGVDGQLVT